MNKIKLSYNKLSFFALGLIFSLLFLLPLLGKMREWWSISIYNYSSIFLTAPGFLLILIALLTPENKIKKIGEYTLSKKAYLLILCFISILMIILMSIFSVKHNFFGDGNLINAITGANIKIPFAIGNQNIKFLITKVAALYSWSTAKTFRTFSILGSLLFASGIITIFFSFKRNIFSIIGFILLWVQPYLIFFSDYIETYPLLFGLFILYFALSIKFSGKLSHTLILSFLFLILVLLHPVFLIFLFAHIGRIFLFTKEKEKIIKWYLIGTVISMIIYFIISYIAKVDFSNGFLLPLLPNKDFVYTFFDIRHFFDLFNFTLFLFLPNLFLVVFYLNDKLTAENLKTKIYILYAIPSIMFLLFADFKLGAFDWDVICLFCLPLIISPLLIFLEKGELNINIGIFLIGISLLKLLPWLDINNNTSKSGFFVVNTAKYDAHQQLGTRIYSLSTRLREAGLIELSLKLAENLYKKDGNHNVVARNNYAESLIKAGKYEEALKILREITQEYPDYFRGNANLGELYIEHFNNPDSAYKYLTRAISIDSNSSSVLYALAFIDLTKGKIDEAESKFIRVTKLDPLHADAYAKLGIIMLKKGRIEECVNNFEKAIDLGGIPKVTMENICNTLELLGYRDKSKRCFEKIEKE